MLKISMLLPTHNRADVIPFAIESILNQTEKDFELLIVGDGCSDNTSQVVSRYAKKDTRVKWFDFPKAPGFGYANRNIVLKKARGDYIAYMTHDDLICSDHLEILRTHLDHNSKIDAVCSRSFWVNSKGSIMPSPFNIDNPAILKFFLTKANGVPSASFIHRKSVFKKVGYWDESLPRAADYDYWKRIIKSKKRKNFIFETTPTVFHFKAIWKTEDITFPAGLNLLAPYLLKHSSIIPKTLKVTIPKEKTEQSVFWKKLSSDTNWVYDLRAHSIAFFDQLLQFEFSSFIQRLDEKEQIIKDLHDSKMQLEVLFKEQVKGLEKEFKKLERHNRFVESELEQIKKRLSFKIMRKITSLLNQKSL